MINSDLWCRLHYQNHFSERCIHFPLLILTIYDQNEYEKHQGCTQGAPNYSFLTFGSFFCSEGWCSLIRDFDRSWKLNRFFRQLYQLEPSFFARSVLTNAVLKWVTFIWVPLPCSSFEIWFRVDKPTQFIGTLSNSLMLCPCVKCYRLFVIIQPQLLILTRSEPVLVIISKHLNCGFPLLCCIERS